MSDAEVDTKFGETDFNSVSVEGVHWELVVKEEQVTGVVFKGEHGTGAVFKEEEHGIGA